MSEARETLFADLPKGTIRVFVGGVGCDLPCREGASVRDLRSEALAAHGVLNYKDESQINETWEVRDGAGMLVEPQREADPNQPLWVWRRPGWYG